MAIIEILVNGAAHRIEADSDMPLLWALRDRLGLTGTKYGCGLGQCGICTVHLAGEPVRSCLVLLGSVAGKPVTTIEGLAVAGDHPVQRAWIAEDVPQCGYCQPGQVMAAAALLSRIPHPTEKEIDAAMSGILCRCGTYPRIRKGIHRAVEAGR